MNARPDSCADTARYRRWSASFPEKTPFFHRPEWLDAVCGPEGWRAVVHEESGEIRAAWPFGWTRKWGPADLYLPPYTQFLGPLLFDEAFEANAARYAFHKRASEALLDRLPPYGSCLFHTTYRFHNWMPFMWRGFQQHTRYSYVLTLGEDASSWLNAFSRTRRKQLRKADKAGLRPKLGLSAEEIHAHHARVLAARGQRPSYSIELLARMMQAADAIGECLVVGVYTPSELLCSVQVAVRAGRRAYNILSAIDPERNREGASVLGMHSLLSHLAGRADSLDMLGSIDPAVEQAYREYGGGLHAYMAIYRDTHPLFRMRRWYRRLGKR
jgi:hypothetical protein